MSKMETEIEIKVISESIKKNIHTGRVKYLLRYRGRYITIVPVPKYAFYNGKWEVNDSSTKITGIENKNCPFFLSTGTSNEANFSGVWFPFYRIKERGKEFSYDMDRGWIHKANGLQNSKSLKNFLTKLGFDISNKSFLFFFLEKFHYWWQVSISASLVSSESSLWITHPELIKLRDIALNYRFVFNYSDEHDFLPIENPVTKYIFPNPNKTKSFEGDGDIEEVNKWLDSKNALILKKDV